MKFKKYQKIRRIGDDRTKGILNGRVSVFPKIDGTNASVWMDDGKLKAGSRNRELTLENDKVKAVLLSIDKYCEMESQIELLRELIKEVEVE